jgi:xanthine dehydrogenase iron-sulfur cluster and FAD-binding subunit A
MEITQVFSVKGVEVVVSEEIVQAAQVATEKEYRNFMDWSQTKKITYKCSEDVLLAYFLEKSEKYSAASQWTASSGR